MRQNVLFIVILMLLTTGALVYAQSMVDTVPTDSSAEQAIVGFNEEVRKTARRLRSLEGGISLTTGVTGTLPVSRGGTGVNWSTVPQGAVPYFNAIGSMDTIGIGTTGYYFSSNGTIPSWIPPVEQDFTLVSIATFSAENSKTFTGLTAGTPYLLIIDLEQVTNNEELVLYPNGTLSAIEGTAAYLSSGGTNKLMLHTGVGFGTGSVGSWRIHFKTLQGDATKTAVIIDGFDTGGDARHTAYGILDSDASLSSITINGRGGSMTLTGTAYLYKYATI